MIGSEGGLERGDRVIPRRHVGKDGKLAYWIFEWESAGKLTQNKIV